MAFVDELQLELKAGKGGDGVVRWRHEKFKEFSGPSGGNGGKGGDVVIEGVRDISLLGHYAQFKELAAENGVDGAKNDMHGAFGEDLVLKLPIGSVVTNTETGEVYDITREGQQETVLTGGRGGLGNTYFKSSINTTPEEATPGKRGQSALFRIELKLIADIGLIGLPNAGKSSLLNELTNAKSKIGSYQFTTLEPSLGVMEKYILADIPGLIEGASSGKGLGHTFLRHITRTDLLLHCISLEEGDQIEERYRTIRTELEQYDETLARKQEIVVLTKVDTVDEEQIRKARAAAERVSETRVEVVSVLDDELVKNLRETLLKSLNEQEKSDRTTAESEE